MSSFEFKSFRIIDDDFKLLEVCSPYSNGRAYGVLWRHPGQLET
jgi:hypothetical protein